jgi:hypothetical protein
VNNIRKASITIHLLVVLCFLLPFAEISCGGQTASISGVKMAFGGTVKGEKVSAEPMAMLALLAGVAGFVTALLRSKDIPLLSIITGGAGAILMVLLKSRVSDAVGKQSFGLIQVEMQFAFWSCLLLFLAAAGIGGIALAQRSQAPPPGN